MRRPGLVGRVKQSGRERTTHGGGRERSLAGGGQALDTFGAWEGEWALVRRQGEAKPGGRSGGRRGDSTYVATGCWSGGCAAGGVVQWGYTYCRAAGVGWARRG
ncbi:hypothetical protein GCM10009804_62110 [Kribbella hippodromi]|uniref:Uncharacterized protein n=1 Tax=Kribbella hippodromi TaxID=434347 RepID=A0ABN2E5L9_9ACTN